MVTPFEAQSSPIDETGQGAAPSASPMSSANWLNYHHLFYFYVIATEVSVTKASKRLRLAQSTLSAQLKQFEDQIGIQLFDRKGRNLVLTAMGRRVYEYANEIFNLGNELRDMLRDRAQENVLKVQVGLLDTVAKPIASGIVERILANSQASVMVVEGGIERLLTQLHEHRLDMIISNARISSERAMRLFHRLIEEVPVVVVASPKWSHLKADFPHTLADVPVILPTAYNPLRAEIDQFLQLKHIHPAPRAEVEDVEMMRRLALSGIGVAFLPLPAVEGDIAAGRLVQLNTMPFASERLWLISAHRMVHNPLIRDLFGEISGEPEGL